MKISLYIDGQTNPVPGYEPVEISKLEDIVRSSCDSIILDETLAYLTTEFIPAILSRVRLNGSIIINGTDINEVARGIMVRLIDSQKLNSLLGAGRQLLFSADDIEALLKNNGFKIINKRVNHYKYSVIGVRQ